MPEGQFRGDKPARRPRDALPAGDVARRVQGSRSIAEERGLGRGGEQTGAPRGTRLAGQGAVYAPGDPDSRWPRGLAGAPRSPQGLAAGPGTRFIPAGIWPAVPGPLASAEGLCPVLHRAAHVTPFSRCVPSSEVLGAAPLPAPASPRWGPGQSKGSAQSRHQHWHGHPKTALNPSKSQVLPCRTVTSPGMHRNPAHRAEPGLARAERGRGERGHVPRRGCRGVQGWQCQGELLQGNDAPRSPGPCQLPGHLRVLPAQALQGAGGTGTAPCASHSAHSWKSPTAAVQLLCSTAVPRWALAAGVCECWEPIQGGCWSWGQ